MRTTMSWIVGLLTLAASSLYAQDISGDWQGALKTPAAELRIVLHIAKETGGGWKATLFSIDQGPDGFAANSVTLQGPTLRFAVDQIRGAYDGKLSTDGASIDGTWTQGGPLPLKFQRATKETAWQIDPSPHTAQFITVDQDVKLEVLDWGGSGRPVVLLTGLGNNAHVFDKFAPKLTSTYHVYGITRRGFGASSSPAPSSVNYSADRLGDDVLAVIDSLKLNRPVLVGHSIAGEELSSIGSRHPEKVAGLIYLDAGYSYAYYDRSRGDLMIDLPELKKKLEQLPPLSMPQDPKALVRELLETSLPTLERDLRDLQKNLEASSPAAAQPAPTLPAAYQAIIAGAQKYTNVPVPILAIFAVPHDRGLTDPAARAADEARDLETTGAQAKAFETGLPSANVVRLPHANHYVFRSNEADVLREMNAFLGSLPQ